jgi:translation initiation factor IF-2
LSLSTNAKIYAFNVKIMNIAKKLADTEKLAIQTYTIIYELLEDLEKQALKLLEPNIDEEVIGKAKIIAEFNIKGNHIAGSKIIQGKIKKANPVHLEREGKILADAQIKSIQKEKKEIEEASSGSEIGLVLKPDLDFKMGDVIISYKN